MDNGFTPTTNAVCTNSVGYCPAGTSAPDCFYAMEAECGTTAITWTYGLDTCNGT